MNSAGRFAVFLALILISWSLMHVFVLTITDLHLGEMLGRQWLEGRVAQVNDLRPDIILMTGDLLNEVVLVEPLLPVLRRLHARLGVYAVTGNQTWIVSRGTGFWGPPMRLFRGAEILRITLRRPGA